MANTTHLPDNRLHMPSRWRLGLLFALIILAGNTFVFTWTTANPLIMSDTWHHIEPVLIPYAQGELQPGDLFHKRSAFDHSQPLRRAITLANYEWFALDFRFEAIVGVIAAFASLAILWFMARSARAGRFGDDRDLLVFLSLAAAYLSLNATSVFDWPLLTTAFTNHLFILAFAWCAWLALRDPSTKSLSMAWLAGFALCVAGDDTGLVCVLAVSIAALLYGLFSRTWRQALPVVFAASASYLAYAVFYRMIASTSGHGVSSFPVMKALAGLLENLDEVHDWIMTPLAASLVQHSMLVEHFGHHADVAVVLLAAILACAHVAFWLSASRNEHNVLSFSAMAIMLLFYGLVMAILLGRGHEATNLWQPRYSIIYRWNLIALFMMLLAQCKPDGAKAPAARTMGLVLAVCFLALQVPMGMAAWQARPYIEKIQRAQASQILAFADAPIPGKCIPGVNLCRFAPAERRQVLAFLRNNQLNVFSTSFRARHGIDAGDGK